jgi:hypothetical protein
MQRKAVDNVVDADRADTARCIVAGIDAPSGQVLSGQLRHVGVAADLAVGDDDEEVDVAPVVRVSTA